VDFGSLAPTQIFVEAFASFGIPSAWRRRAAPWGCRSATTSARCSRNPPSTRNGSQRFGAAPGEQDIDALYERFMPMQIEKVGDYSQPIPGAIETLAWLRAQGLKIGSCSGYPRQVLDVLLPLAAAPASCPTTWWPATSCPRAAAPAPTWRWPTCWP
jgi:phosphonoacetaldehyde hydrolase